jgi:5-formyltetrahydrofolate cyclo-ligase
MENRQSLRRELRLELRQRRRALSPQQQQLAAEHLCKRIARQPIFLRSKRIALYLPNDGEIDPTPLLHAALQRGKACYLPVLKPGPENRLWFVRFDEHTRMEPNRYGIPEPKADPRNRVRAENLDMVLMPLVGFDAEGNRMGMGGGFYDRTFAFKHQTQNHRPYLLGLAHSCQQVDKLDTEHWDIPLHSIATESQILVASRSHWHRDFILS